MNSNTRKIKATSLMSEHSIEYCLVPRMLTILKQSFQDITPIYPAMMREFGKRSYKNQNAFIRALAMFPRRPKITNDFSSEIYITINQELHAFEDFMRAIGVPTIAGCPMVKTIWELSCDPEICWIDIRHASLNKYLNEINYEETSGALLTEQEILRRVSESQLLSIESLGDAVRTFRGISGGSYIYGPQYKPVFFLIK